jgi:hypothetical protein
MGLSRKGRVVSEETRMKIGESRRGIKHSEEAKKKISEATMGRYKGRNHPRAKVIKIRDTLTGDIYEGIIRGELEHLLGIKNPAIYRRIKSGRYIIIES